MKLIIPTGKRLSIPTGKRLTIPQTEPGYTPPIDYAVSYAFGLRTLVDGYVGALIRLRRSSDDAESDFSALDGIVDIAAIATWLGGSDGFVVTWYDQSGSNRDIVRATDAEQPKYIASHNGHPAVLWDASDDYLRATGLDLSQPLEVLWVWQSDDQPAGYPTFFDSVNADKRANGYITVGGKLGIYAGLAVLEGVLDETDADTHYTSAQFSGASSVVRNDGVQIATGNPGTDSMDGLTLGAVYNGSAVLDGHMYECVISAGGLLSAGERAALEADQATFYGVS